MRAYSFLPKIVMRTPLYSYSQMQIDYSELLKDKYFRTALFLASRTFFNELNKSQFNYDLLTDKQKHSVKRYANRTIYRSTPFGLFSSFSLIDCQNRSETSDIIVNHPTIDIKPDFIVLQQVWELFLKTGQTSFSFKANQSFQFN